MATKKKKYQDGGEPRKGKPTANIQINTSTGKSTGKKGLAYNSNPSLVYNKYPEGKVTESVQDLYRGDRGSAKPKADSYKIRHKDEALGRTSGYLVKESKAYTLPAKEIKTGKLPEKLQKGGTMKKMKTGGMVNANANLKATATAGSKGVKSGVNPKAAASSTAKKPSKPRSKAPKKATPGKK